MSFYKNINLQYITLNNFNLYIVFPPTIGDTRQFVQVRKKVWLVTSGFSQQSQPEVEGWAV